MNDNKLYVGRLEPTCTEENLREAFSPFGAIARIDMKNGYGFIAYEDPSGPEAAQKELNGAAITGSSSLNIQIAKPKSDRTEYSETRGKGQDKYRIVIENVLPETTWMDLKDFARDRGVIANYSDVRAVGDSASGVLAFATVEETEEAVRKLDGESMLGSKLSVRRDETYVPKDIRPTNGRDYRRDNSRDRDRSDDRRRYDDRDYDRRPSDYDRRPRDYGHDRRPSDYDRRPDDYDRRPSDYDRRPRDYDHDRRPSDYDRRPDDYDRRSGGYDRRPADYDRRPVDDRRGDDYDRRPRDYDRRPSDYDRRPGGYDRYPSPRRGPSPVRGRGPSPARGRGPSPRRGPSGSRGRSPVRGPSPRGRDDNRGPPPRGGDYYPNGNRDRYPGPAGVGGRARSPPRFNGQQGVCFAFQRGSCNRGETCKYLHTGGSNGGGNGV